MTTNDDELDKMFIGTLRQHQRSARLFRIKRVGQIGLAALTAVLLLQIADPPGFLVPLAAASCTFLIVCLAIGLHPAPERVSSARPSEVESSLRDMEAADQHQLARKLTEVFHDQGGLLTKWQLNRFAQECSKLQAAREDAEALARLTGYEDTKPII